MKFRNIWGFLSTIASIYIVYRQLKSLEEANRQFYEELPPEYQAMYDEYFGKMGAKSKDIFDKLLANAVGYGKNI